MCPWLSSGGFLPLGFQMCIVVFGGSPTMYRIRISYMNHMQNLIPTFWGPPPTTAESPEHFEGVYSHDSNADTRDTAVVGRNIDQKYLGFFCVHTLALK